MQIFVDEGGKFTLDDGWCLVCALALPDRETGPARRKLAFLSRDWPHAAGPELKGGSVTKDHLAALVDLLYARSALFFAVAIDMAKEGGDSLANHKRGQADLLTAHLTPEHHPMLVEQIWGLRRTLEKMPQQLYVQSILMRELTADVVERTTMYFAQRRPSELGSFTWTIDAKDPKRITTQEQWWMDTLGPLQESRSEAKPLSRVYDPRFDYSFFDKAYRFEKAKWYPDKPRRPMVGYDIGKILLDHVSFKDSRSDILLQAIDILTSFLRRSFIGQISDLATVRTLGRLQIRRQIKGHIQSMTIVGITPGKRTYPFVRMLEQMSLAGRSMLVPKTA